MLISQPKTVQSKRTIVLSDKTVDIIKGLKLAQDDEKAELGESYADGDWVFCWQNGTRLRPEWVTGHFTKLLEKTDLPTLRLHDLRHTHATLLLLDGVHIKIVQERLGHTTPGFTLVRYGHTQPGMQRLAANSMDNMID